MEIVSDIQLGLYETVTLDDFISELYIDFHNQRVKLIKYNGNTQKIAKNSIEMCNKYGMGKIITSVYEKDTSVFIENGFVLEGTIEGYYEGKTGYCVSYFHDVKRAVSNKLSEEDEIIKMSEEYANQYHHSINKDFVIRTADLDDADTLAHLYNTVFKTYPTPMDSPEYIKSVIKSNKIIFKVAEYDNQIVSAASADLHHELLHAEITDCATLEQFRGRGLLSHLVYHLEETLKEKKYITLFSLARALSLGINIVLSKHGYNFTGRQINNCNIMGNLEDMNIWVKKIES